MTQYILDNITYKIHYTQKVFIILTAQRVSSTKHTNVYLVYTTVQSGGTTHRANLARIFSIIAKQHEQPSAVARGDCWDSNVQHWTTQNGA